MKLVLHETLKWSDAVDKKGKHINLVVGNTSADLDSVCSSLAAAWLFQCFDENDILYIPVINVKRQDAFILFGVRAWLEGVCKINLENLVFIDDPCVQKCAARDVPNDSWSVTLVDHNLLDVRQKWLKPNVVRVIDHHQPVEFLFLLNNGELNDNQVMDSEIRYGVGSCSTLIAGKWCKALQCLYGSQYGTAELFQRAAEILGSGFLYLLLGPVLKDTAFLCEALRGDRWCALDEEMCTALEAAALHKGFNQYPGDNACGGIREFVKRALENAKLTIDVLTGDIGLGRSLQLDFKIFDYTRTDQSRVWRFGYSSYELSLREMFSHSVCSSEHVLSQISAHMLNFQLDVVVLMSFFEGQRQFGIAASPSSVELCKQVVKSLECDGVVEESLPLLISVGDTCTVPSLEIRNQKSPKDSRKIVERKISAVVGLCSE